VTGRSSGTVAQTLEVQAHTVGMQLQAPGELVGARRSSQLAEEREETRAGGLRERVDGGGRHVHDDEFRTRRLGKTPARS
jgi:hypothetical protein